jgi:hypothetical protein
MSDLELFKVFDAEKQEHRYELRFPDGTVDRMKDSKLEYQFNSDSVSFIRQNQNWPLKVSRDQNSMKYTCEGA